MRAKAAIENLTKERQAIIVTEIPYQVNKSRLIERIAELVNDKIIDDVCDIRDESDRDGMRIVIELKRGAEPQIVLNQLFKHTSMQESFSMIFLAVVNGQPTEMGLIQAIQHFIDHRVDVVRRRTAYLLARATRTRAHPGRLPHRARPPRRDHQDHPRHRPRGRKPSDNLLAASFKISTRTGGAASAAAEGTPHRQAGRRHPRTATLPPDAALHRRDSEAS